MAYMGMPGSLRRNDPGGTARLLTTQLPRLVFSRFGRDQVGYRSFEEWDSKCLRGGQTANRYASTGTCYALRADDEVATQRACSASQ